MIRCIYMNMLTTGLIYKTSMLSQTSYYFLYTIEDGGGKIALMDKNGDLSLIVSASGKRGKVYPVGKTC